MLNFLKDTLYPVISEIYRFALKKILQRKKITLPLSMAIKLSYANSVPSLSKVAFGGRVKLYFLNELFPEQKNEFNILYIVSSVLPIYAQEWFRVCKKWGIKIVWNQNGVGYPAWAGAHYEKINKPRRDLMHRVDWVIYQSEFCKVSSDKYLGEFKGPCSILYNCVDTSFFTPSLIPLSLSPLQLLIMGSHQQSYRVIKAIETVAILRKLRIDARLNIAGRLAWYGAKREVKKKINLLNLSGYVTILGPYLQSEAPSIYRQAHILLHLKYNDPCPSVPIEAMACGIPVIGSKSGGVPELLMEAGGITLEVPQSWEKQYVPESEAIANTVIKIMDDWHNWSIKARKLAVDNLDKIGWIEKHKEIFSKLIHSTISPNV
jgi:glycosyltransferase involved in cell wall biosynthesis